MDLGPSGVPVVDYTELVGAPRRSGAVELLGRGIEATGFVAITGHPVPASLLDRGYDVARQLFALPPEARRACETPWDGRLRGYTPFGVEHAKDRTTPDLKEFWHVGREPSEAPGLDLPANRFPAELPEARTVLLELFHALDAVALDLLDALGRWLDLPDGVLRALARGGNSVMRVVHYPPLGPDAPPGALRAAEHEDVNLLTVLPVATEPGLELLTRDGRWVPLNPPPGVLVCDTGDMMQWITGGRIPSTTHRVVNPPAMADRPRYSLPFFCHPQPDAWLAPPPGRGDPVRARDFLHRRLVEIGLAPG